MPTDIQPVAPGDLITADLLNRLIDKIRALEQELAPLLVNPVIESVVPGESNLPAITPGRRINIRGRNFAADPSDNHVEFVALPPNDEPRTFPAEGESVTIDVASSNRSLIRVLLPQAIGDALGTSGRLVRIRVTVGRRPPAEFEIRTGLSITLPPPIDPNDPIFTLPISPRDPTIGPRPDPFGPLSPFVRDRKVTDVTTITDIVRGGGFF